MTNGGSRSRTGERRSWSDAERITALETDMDFIDRRLREIKDSQDRQNRILVAILVTLIGAAAAYVLSLFNVGVPPTG